MSGDVSSIIIIVCYGNINVASSSLVMLAANILIAVGLGNRLSKQLGIFL